jgi:choice-of-anchor B domain-containing protein
MKKFGYIVITICLATINFLSAQTNVSLLGQLDPYPNTQKADIWGYAANGREYALMGVTGGTSIIDVTDPANPVEVEFIAGPMAPPYEWRDIKTHLNYAYVVTEGSGSGQGLQIIDLSNLPASASLVNTIDTWFSHAHDIFIDNGYAYVVGTGGGGGMHILDLSDPVNPIQTAFYTASGYIHDVYVWNDTAIVSATDSYDLVDVSNKNNPQLVSGSAFISGIYAHSGWMTEDKRYFLACEEFNVRDLMVYDLQDRSTWDLVVPSWQMSGDSPIHNVFVLGNYAHISYYKEGYVVLDISDPTNPTFAGQYDTYPGTGGTYEGAWGVYPYLPSGHIIVSDMSTGLYVINFDSGVPVELTAFTGRIDKQKIILNWSTATEINNLGFEIQRKFVDEDEYRTIGFVEGYGTTTETHNYSFSDSNPEVGSYNYRLKQVDFDGTSEFSQEIEVEFFNPSIIELAQNYPNPFNPSTNINFSIPESGLVTLKIYNIIGEEVAELINEFREASNYTANFNAGNLTSGIYIAKLSSGNNIQTIKMSLLK